MEFDQLPGAAIQPGRSQGVGRQRRVVRLRMDPAHHALLARLAAEADVTVEQLAAVWLRDKLDHAAGARWGVQASSDLVTILKRIETRSPGAESATRGPRGARRPGGRKGSLHGEIVNVLREHGAPMTAAQIAEAIRVRGEYEAPRSGHPITGAAVSRRIANPYYRTLFERDGRQVGLADRAHRRSS